MGWVWCVHCKKIKMWHRCIKSRCDFVSRTFVLTAPVRYVLHQVSCSYETIRNALKYCETDRNISLASNFGCVRCEKSRYDFAAPTFALIAPVHPVLHRVSCSYETIPNTPKTIWNTLKHVFRVQWVGSGALVAKNYNATSRHNLLH